MASKPDPDDVPAVIGVDSFESLRTDKDDPEFVPTIDTLPVFIPDAVSHAAKSAPKSHHKEG